MPEGMLQLAKISKVLLALEQGRVAEFKGKNLEEIKIEPYGKTQDISVVLIPCLVQLQVKLACIFLHIAERVDLGSNMSESEDEE